MPENIQVVQDFLWVFQGSAFTDEEWTIDPSNARAVTAIVTVENDKYCVNVTFNVSLGDVSFKIRTNPYDKFQWHYTMATRFQA